MRSDCNHICLLRISATLALLGKHNYEENSCEPGEEWSQQTITEELINVQKSLRGNICLDAVAILRPFLRLLRASYLSAPFKVSALETVNTFISCSLLPSENSDGLFSEIIDSVVSCRFVQTDVQLDEVVQLHIIDTLHRFLFGDVRFQLTNELVWMIIEKSYSLVTQSPSSISGHDSLLAQSAQKVLFTALQSVIELSQLSSRVGLPCLLKCLGFFTHVLECHVKLSFKGSQMSSSSSNSSLSLLVGNLDSASNDSDFPVFIAVKALHSVLQSDGRLDIVRKVVGGCLPVLLLCTDDLPKWLTLFCTSNPSPSVLLSALPVVQTLIQLFLPVQKVLIECFMTHIYLKTLYQLKGLLIESRNSSPSRRATSTSDSPLLLNRNFESESLRIVLSSLTDLISEPSFLPALFISFDCDPSKQDIVVPLMEMLCFTSRFSFIPIYYDAEDLQGLVSICMHCLLTVTSQINHRVDNDPAESASSTGFFERIPHYFEVNRKSKKIFVEASKRFMDKPSRGLSYLQELSILKTPLECQAVARFLRVCTSLPKDVVGSFIGELGKDSPKHEVDGKDFHAAILTCYVKTFEFNGQPLLRCMRIFLAAFRLPGEAQQIDRILGDSIAIKARSVFTVTNCNTHS